METLFYIALGLFYIVVLPVLTFVALLRSGNQGKEVGLLKRRLDAMTERLVALDAKFRTSPQPAPQDTATATETKLTALEKWRQEQSESRENFVPPIAETVAFPQSMNVAPATEQPVAFPLPPSILETPPSVAVTAKSPFTAQAPETTRTTPTAPAATRPQWLERFLAWCVGGNPLVRAGILILFFGVSFLLKLAADYGWLPLELRLSGVALGAAALLGIGWRLRNKRRNYGLLLQGGGIGILYLVIYAAFAYFKLIPQESALLVFLLLFAVCALSAFLAVRQDASALAVMGMTGGFAAPVLISTGSGNHIALFSYFALLNAGVLGIAWFRAWRALNLLGFVFTLGVGSLWGVKYYTAAHLQSVEFFLILFFLFYVAVALLYAVRRELELKRYVDGALVFGVPVAFSLLQTQIVGEIEFAMAWSAVALGAFYLLLATWLARYRLERLRLVFEAMLALGVLFLTLAVPLAFEGTRLTAAIWAVEGAGLCWVAVRQQRRLALAGGLFLQVFAAASFYLDRSSGIVSGAPLVLNSWYIGTLMLALSALFCGWRLRSDAARSWLGALGQNLSLLFGSIGLLWWLGSGGMEILRFFGPFATASFAYLLFAVLTAWLAYGASRRLCWPEMAWVALALSPALLLAALLSFFSDLLPFANHGWYAWPLAVILAYALLFRQERCATSASDTAPPLFLTRLLGPLHALMFWTLCLVIGLEFHGFVASHVPEGVWQWSSWAFAAALLLLALIHLAPRLGWPVARFRLHYLMLGAAPVAALALGWAALGFASDGNPEPLPYLPLLNPVELCQLLVFAALFFWVRANREFFNTLFRAHTGVLPAWLLVGAAALLFLLLNAALLRTLHQYAALDYRIGAVITELGAQLYFVALWIVFAVAGLLLLRHANISRQRAFLAIVLPLLALLWFWSVRSNLSVTSGEWGAFPLLNPFDLAQAGVVALSLFLLSRLQPMDIKPAPYLPIFAATIGGSGFIWLNAVLLRTLHHWLDIPYRFDALYASTTAQAALSLLWGLLALILMVWAVRRAQRALWFVGITLLVLTVGKLFFVELSNIGGTARIFSFIGVGVLLLLIGYLAPLPPKKKEHAQS
ncbi:MAG: DUF2339 domain-containing protein [Burkholderiales bacterium]|jgi:uncharacterized membrane protein|nr:DUF2339 domain-containing protein [Burkholderiales bacterium]